MAAIAALSTAGGLNRASGTQAEFEPGSDGRVLANKLGVASPDQIDEVELVLLEKLYNAVFGAQFPDRALTVADLQSWHRQWLGNVYLMAVQAGRDLFDYSPWDAEKPRYFSAIEQGLEKDYGPMAELVIEALKD